jgi:hypothetical protein
VSTGSNREPNDAAAQMRSATQRLRDRAWMIAPMTAGDVGVPDLDAPGSNSWLTPLGVRVVVTSRRGQQLTPRLRRAITAKIDDEPDAGPGLVRHVTLNYGVDVTVD